MAPSKKKKQKARREARRPRSVWVRKGGNGIYGGKKKAKAPSPQASVVPRPRLTIPTIVDTARETGNAQEGVWERAYKTQLASAKEKKSSPLTRKKMKRRCCGF